MPYIRRKHRHAWPNSQAHHTGTPHRLIMPWKRSGGCCSRVCIRVMHMAVVVQPYTLASLQRRDGGNRILTDQAYIACTKREVPWGVRRVAWRVNCIPTRTVREADFLAYLVCMTASNSLILLGGGMFTIFLGTGFLFSIRSIIFALISPAPFLSPLRSRVTQRHSDPGSHSSARPHHCGACLHFYRQKSSAPFLPLSTRVELCVHTLYIGAFCVVLCTTKSPRGGSNSSSRP